MIRFHLQIISLLTELHYQALIKPGFPICLLQCRDLTTYRAFLAQLVWRVPWRMPSLSKGKTTITVTTRGGTSNSYTFTVK